MLLADIVNEVVTELLTVQPGVASKIGARFTTSNIELVPRLVWVPINETFEPPWNNSENPRQLYSRMARMVVHIQGGDPARTGDLGPTETLMHNLVAAIYRVCHGYVTIGAGQWPSEDGSTSSSGPLYLLEVTFGIPVTDTPIGTTTILTIAQTPVAQFPSGNTNNP